MKDQVGQANPFTKYFDDTPMEREVEAPVQDAPVNTAGDGNPFAQYFDDTPMERDENTSRSSSAPELSRKRAELDPLPASINPVQAAPQGRLSSAGNSAIQAFGKVISSLPKAVGEGAVILANNFGDDPIWGNPDHLTPEDTTAYEIGESIDKWFSKFAVNPEYQEEFTAQLASGAGSIGGYLFGGFAAKAVKIPALAATMGLGATTIGVEGVEDYLGTLAADEKADPEMRANAFELHALLGTSEALPIQHALNKLDTYTGGGVKRILKEGFKGGIEELVQEVGQQIGQNAIAKNILEYDKERGLLNGTVESGEVGFTLGFLLNTLTATIGGRRAGRGKSDSKEEDSPEAEQVENDNQPLNAQDVLGDVEGESIEDAAPTVNSEGEATSLIKADSLPDVGQDVTEQQGAPEPSVEYFDSRMNREEFRSRLEGMSEELIVGGGSTLIQDPNFQPGESDVRDDNGKPTGDLIRTPSLNPEWFQSLMDDDNYSMSVGATLNAVEKAVKGKRLGVRQSRVVGAMLDHVSGERNSDENLAYARDQLRIAREARAASKMPDVPDWLFEEQDYTEDSDGLSRLLLEFSEHAKGISKDMSASVDDLLYSDQSDEEIISGVQQLFGEYYGRKSQESAEAHPGQEAGAGLPGAGQEPVSGELAGGEQQPGQQSIDGSIGQQGQQLEQEQNELDPLGPDLDPLPTTEELLNAELPESLKPQNFDGRTNKELDEEAGDIDIPQSLKPQSSLDGADKGKIEPLKAMDKDPKPGYKRSTIEVNGQEITYDYNNKVYGTSGDSQMAHFEFHSDLVSETGYKSHFVNASIVSGNGGEKKAAEFFANEWMEKPKKPSKSRANKKHPGKKKDLAGEVDQAAQSKKDEEVKAKNDQENKEDAANSFSGEPDLLSGGELEADLFPDGNRDTDKDIDKAANQSATSPKNNKPQPTDGQKNAGNYEMGHKVVNIGKNPQGQFVRQDDKGVRSYEDGGVIVSQSVGIIPGQGLERSSVDQLYTEGNTQFLTTDEVKTFDKKLKKSSVKSKSDEKVKKHPGKKSKKKDRYGKDNKLFTESAAEEARRILKEELGNLNANINPKIMQAGATLAGYHIEAGARKFSDYSKAMINDLGQGIEPYLRALYEGIRHYPGFDAEGMSSADEIDNPVESVKSKSDAVSDISKPVKSKTTDNAGHKLAASIAKAISNGKQISWRELFAMADDAFGGTQADGSYSVKDAYDSMEMAMNLTVMDMHFFENAYNKDGNLARARDALNQVHAMMQLLPTQTKRTEEQDQLQQYSTPHTHSFIASWVANLRSSDVVLEPSAGTGNLAVHALKAGVPSKNIHVNELGDNRISLLKGLFDNVTQENATYLNSALPQSIKPTVVIMNPPFSADSNKIGKKDQLLGAKHVEQALKRLEDGGRLVAILGKGMAPNKSRTRDWWKKIQNEYNVRANIQVSGQEYKKFGTTFDNQFIVIDKTGKTNGDIITGSVDSVAKLLLQLSEVQGDRTYQRKQDQTKSSVKESAVKVEGEAGRSGDLFSTAGENSFSEKPKRPGKTGSRAGNGNAGTVTTRAPGNSNAVSTGKPRRGESSLSTTENEKPAPITTSAIDTALDKYQDESGLEVQNADITPVEIGDSSFEQYRSTIKIPGAQPHPTKLAESAAMSAVIPPQVTYKPNIDQEVVDSGRLSDVQIESIIRAGQSHSEILPGGERKGYFIGDGTGVGKGAQIAGIIEDNKAKGRNKSVWISERQILINDASRDIKWVNGDPDDLFNLSSVKGEVKAKKGVLFTTYDTLRSQSKAIENAAGEIIKPSKDRVDQIIDWLGEDFDGVIAFDEAHNMANAVDQKGGRGVKKAADKALAGIDLQRRLPKARIVYVSATGATEVENLGYMDRLGLWGEGTPFSDKNAFIISIKAGGVAAMEVVAKDMKAMGVYTSRSLSFDDVGYSTIEHELTQDQRKTYDELAGSWQIVLSNVMEALGNNGAITESQTNGRAKSAAMSGFWGSHQRFFNQVLTGMQMPSVITDVEKQLKLNNSIVMQLVNTNEAVQKRRLAQAAKEGLSLDDIDITPRDILMQYVANGFPTNQFEEYTDDDGNVRSRPMLDSENNNVQNPESIAKREELLDRIGELKVPEGPLEQVLNYFGSDAVAEITGRKRRLVRGKDGTVVEEKMSEAKKKLDVDNFMSGKKRILIFSDSGGTGRSYHASNLAKNKQKRIHYLVQPGWKADKAVQGTGRTHRTNQAVAPHYKLVTTNMKAQRRFISTIARRLDQLGALTKGQRDTTSQGLFSSDMNLEGEYGNAALDTLIRDINNGHVESITMADFEEQTGMKVVDEDGQINEDNKPTVPKFLNRLLSMKIDMMDIMFDAFSGRLETVIEYAKEQGTFDSGMETVRADEIRKVDEKYTQNKSVRYVKVELDNPSVHVDFDNLPKEATFKRNIISGKLYAFTKAISITDVKTGSIVSRRRRMSTKGGDYVTENQYSDKYEKVAGGSAAIENEWATDLGKLSPVTTTTKHMIAGTMLPIWDKLPASQPKIIRMLTKDKEVILGREIKSADVSDVLKAIGINVTVPKLSNSQWLNKVVNDGVTLQLANGWKIQSRVVSGEARIEVSGPTPNEADMVVKQGGFKERISFKTRLFLPMNDAVTFDRVLKNKQVVEFFEKGESRPASSLDKAKAQINESVDEVVANREDPAKKLFDKGRDSKLDTKKTENNLPYKVEPGTKPGYSQIKFDEKPGDFVRSKLKEAGFRWSPRNSVWYGKTSSLPENLDDLPPLSRQRDDNSGIIPGKIPKGVSHATVQEAIDEFKAEHNGYPLGIQFEIRATKDDAFGAGATEYLKKRQTNTVKGAYYGRSGIVKLIASDIRSKQDALETIRHEILGHHGLNLFIKADKRAFLDKIKASRNERTLKKLWAKIDYEYKGATEDIKADELLADLAESKQGRVSKLFNDLIQLLRKFLIKIGWIKDKHTKGELIAYLNDISHSIAAGAEQEFFPKDDFSQFSQKRNSDDKNKTTKRRYSPEQQAAIDKGGFGLNKEILNNPLKTALGKAKDTIDESKQVWKTILRQGFLDQYDSFRTIINDKNAWMMANLSGSSGGVMEAILEYGRPFMSQGAIDVDVDKKSISQILEPLGDEVNDWLKWIAGNRAERLATEDRERLFQDVDIKALKSLSNSEQVRNSSLDFVGREKIYESVRVEFEEMNNAVIQIGIDTGVINPTTAKIWKEQGFYVPFYRVVKEEAGSFIKGPYTGGGLVKQTAYKQLTGADIPIGDLLTNVVMNWNHIVSSGLKNQAATAALISAEEMGIARQVSENKKSNEAVFIRISGKKMWLELDKSKEGQLVLESLMSLNYDGMNNFMMKAARKFKRILTYGVTANPEFKVANLVRDSVQAVAVADMSTNIVKNLMQGFKATSKGNPTIARMIAGGGAFSDSGYIHGSDPDALERLIKKDIDRITILDSPGRIGKMWDKYQDFGARLENVNRAANFEQDLSRDGISLLESNFNSRDHLDFQRTGAFTSIRILAQVVPFLNARMQGLDKLGRSGFDKKQQKQFKAVIGLYAMAAVLLYLYMKDDDDYDEAEQWERDTYHLFKFPGSETMFRFPRPFEVGFIATVAERAVEQMVNDEVHGELFFERVFHGLSETLSFNPVPQMVMPAVEVWANHNTFTNRKIESQSMKNLSPAKRKRAWTSETTIAMSKGFETILWDDVTLSPVQIEHLVNGYFGWMGGFALAASDEAIRFSGLAPSTPEWKIQDYMVVGRFARTGPSRGSRYLTEFYENLNDTTRVFADMNFAKQIMDKEDLISIAEENKDLTAIHHIYVGAQKAISTINKQIMLVRIKKMPDDEKAEEIDRLNVMKKEIAKKVVRRTNIH